MSNAKLLPQAHAWGISLPEDKDVISKTSTMFEKKIQNHIWCQITARSHWPLIHGLRLSISQCNEPDRNFLHIWNDYSKIVKHNYNETSYYSPQPLCSRQIIQIISHVTWECLECDFRQYRKLHFIIETCNFNNRTLECENYINLNYIFCWSFRRKRCSFSRSVESITRIYIL